MTVVTTKKNLRNRSHATVLTSSCFCHGLRASIHLTSDIHWRMQVALTDSKAGVLPSAREFFFQPDFGNRAALSRVLRSLQGTPWRTFIGCIPPSKFLSLCHGSALRLPHKRVFFLRIVVFSLNDMLTGSTASTGGGQLSKLCDVCLRRKSKLLLIADGRYNANT